MYLPSLDISSTDGILLFKFRGEMSLRNIQKLHQQSSSVKFTDNKRVVIDLYDVTYFDSAAAIFINNLKTAFLKNGADIHVECNNEDVLHMIMLVEKHKKTLKADIVKVGLLEKVGVAFYKRYLVFASFMSFIGEFFAQHFLSLASLKNIRYKELLFEINESGVKALSIVAVTSFLIGLVVAYQSAYQLKLYGANIFIVDMLGISILRELSPLITAVVIAGRSGSSYTAQIGAMKITQEIDAMRTMGFDPYMFLIFPKMISLIVVLPILIFVADIMGMLGGMIIAQINLDISSNLFLDRFSEVVEAKHFFVGEFKGPFFGFLIAIISIYRGLGIKEDTQSLGRNTTKSVVESIFAVIMCDAFFSIIFTKLGI